MSQDTKVLPQLPILTDLIAALDTDAVAGSTDAQEAMFSKLTTEDVAKLTQQYNRLGKELRRLVGWWKWEGFPEGNQK